MEVQKPFKCPVCSSRFTNEDHLQVHRRRHEMSLNLSKSGGGLAAQALESFVEETPSPTRFFRNCEEVGLFQDLQNVNPFDESFSKAASATPSTENFEFDFTVATTSSSLSKISMQSTKKCADQDTLNTPQVIGYPTVSSTSFSATSTNIISTISNSSSLSLATPLVFNASPIKLPNITKVGAHEDSPNDLTKQNRITDDAPIPPITIPVQNPGISTTTPTEPEASPVFIGEIELECNPEISLTSSADVRACKETLASQSINSPLHFRTRSKSNLRLTFTQLSEISDVEASSSTSSSNTSQKSIFPVETPLLVEFYDSPEDPQKTMKETKDFSDDTTDPKKTEQLERNRAAALRSRERRKQWVSSLEGKNQNLLSQLSQAASLVTRLRAENQMLREQLARHANCEITRAEESKSQPDTISSKIHSSSTPTALAAVQAPPSSLMTVNQPANSQPVKAKRGRPRKGQEKRSQIVCVPESVSSNCEIPVKVRIYPLKTSSASQILKRGDTKSVAKKAASNK